MTPTEIASTLAPHVLDCEPDHWLPSIADPLLFRCAIHTHAGNGLRFEATCPIHRALTALDDLVRAAVPTQPALRPAGCTTRRPPAPNPSKEP